MRSSRSLRNLVKLSLMGSLLGLARCSKILRLKLWWRVVEETPTKKTYASFQNVANTVKETPVVSVEELVGEPEKKTYASIALPLTVLLLCIHLLFSYLSSHILLSMH